MEIFWIIIFFRLFLRQLVSCNDKELQKTCVYIEYLEKPVNTSETGCPDKEICKRTFNISFINLPPYGLEDLQFIKEILTKCCGTCFKYETINHFSNITEVTLSSINSSDFIFPFLSSATTRKLYGFHYLPYIHAPQSLYITRTDEEINLLKSILRLYPLIIVCLLLAVVSGFIAWIIETWKNEEEFPRPFMIGWFEGIWWSFITMTTVGYGDKTPKSIAARLFSVIWILTGIIIVGIITGELTQRIIQANSPPPPNMKDAQVGSLRYRDYDAYVISQHGGFVRWNEDATDFISDVTQLITKLQERKIDGFLLDKWTLYHTTHVLNDVYREDISQRSMISFFTQNTIRTEKSYVGQHLAYGILVKQTNDYEYFKDFVQDGRMEMEIGSAYFWNKLRIKIKDHDDGKFYSSKSNKLFSPSQHYFVYSIIVISAMMVIIVLVGIFYEMKRKRNTPVKTEEKLIIAPYKKRDGDRRRKKEEGRRDEMAEIDEMAEELI